MIFSAREFGEVVKAARRQKGWSQAKLAWHAGTGERFIVDLEKGKESCQLGKALTVAREVGINLVDADALRQVPRCDVSSSPQADDDELSHIPKF